MGRTDRTMNHTPGKTRRLSFRTTDLMVVVAIVALGLAAWPIVDRAGTRPPEAVAWLRIDVPPLLPPQPYDFSSLKAAVTTEAHDYLLSPQALQEVRRDRI